MKNKTRFVVQASLIAALYVVLTYLSSLFGLSSGAIQLRLSEALTVLPVYFSSAVPGLFIGCILANILTGSAALDIIFGSLATLIGAVLTYIFRKKKLLAPIFPIISNTVIIPFVLVYGYGIQGSLWYFMLTVGIGEILSCGVLGLALLKTFFMGASPPSPLRAVIIRAPKKRRRCRRFLGKRSSQAQSDVRPTRED